MTHGKKFRSFHIIPKLRDCYFPSQLHAPDDYVQLFTPIDGIAYKYFSKEEYATAKGIFR